MSRYEIVFALSIVLSFSFIFYAPLISNTEVYAATPNLTVTTISGLDYLNTNKSETFNITFIANVEYGLPSNVTIYIPPNNETSTDNEPYFDVNTTLSYSNCSSGVCGYKFGVNPIVIFSEDMINGKVVNITFNYDGIPTNAKVNIYFNATPINPQIKLDTNWFGTVASDNCSTNISTPFTIIPPHIELLDSFISKPRTVYLGENYTIKNINISNNNSEQYGGYAFNVTATAENLTGDLDIISTKTLDILESFLPGLTYDTFNWTINAKTLGLSNISITATDQTGDYNDTINITINVLNLTVTTSILEPNPKVGDQITIVANITDNASELFQPDIDSTNANVSYLALNATSGDIEQYTSELCPINSFEINETLSGDGYTVLTCDNLLVDKSGIYNITISFTDQYFIDNGTQMISKSKTTINKFDFTVGLGKVNITKTFAMILSVNDSFDNQKGFWDMKFGSNEMGISTTSASGTSAWSYTIDDSENNVMSKNNIGEPYYNILIKLPPSKNSYIEVDVLNMSESESIVFRDNGTSKYVFRNNGLSTGDNPYYYFEIRKIDETGIQFIENHKYYVDNLDGYHKLSVYVIDNEITTLIDNNIIMQIIDTDTIPTGNVGLGASQPATFDNFKVYNIIDPEQAILLNQTFKLRSFVEIQDGDLWGPLNMTLSINNSGISNISDLNIINDTNFTKDSFLMVDWDLDTQLQGATNLTINMTPQQGTPAIKYIDANIVPLLSYADQSTINYSDTQKLIINVTGFGPSLQGSHGMFSATLKQQYRTTNEQLTNFIFNSTLSDIQNNNYVYYRYYALTETSGNYNVNMTMKNQYNQNITNTTSTFLVNYGYPEMSFENQPEQITQGNDSSQKISIKAMGGDIRNMTFNFSSLNLTLLDLSIGNNSNQTIDFIPRFIDLELDTKYLSWNITAGNTEGSVNITVSANSTNSLYNISMIKDNSIYISSVPDTTPPLIENITIEYNVINLKEDIYLYADIYEVSGFTAIMEVTYPGSIFTKNLTLQYLSGNTYFAKFSDANMTTNETEFYRLKVYATDSGDFKNSTDNTTTFNTTDQYQINLTLNYNLFNLGEDVISQINVTTVNNNPVADFNLTFIMNKTGDENETILLQNNITNNYTYTINASDPIGQYLLILNISKDGNTANLSGNFSVSKDYFLIYTSPTMEYRQISSGLALDGLSAPKINVTNARGEQISSGLSVIITCGGDVNKTLYPDENSIFNHYEIDEDDLCHVPTLIGSFKIFPLVTYASDSNNNSGTTSIDIRYGTAAPPNNPDGGGAGGSTPSMGGSLPMPQDYYNNTPYEKTKDFWFTITTENIYLVQGQDTEIEAEIENTGDYDLNITAEYITDCCNINLNKSYFIKSKNKQSITIKISSKLSEIVKKHKLKIILSNGDIVKEDIININIEDERWILRLNNLKEDYNKIESLINDLKRVGINTDEYIQQLESSKIQIQNAQQSINENNLTSLESTTKQLTTQLTTLDAQIAENEKLKWILENKYPITGVIISSILLLFILKSYILPLIILSLELQYLKSKEIKLTAEEKSTEKEYFTRVIDKLTFNKIITTKHEKLTDIRTRMAQLRKSLKKLMHGHRLTSEDINSRHKIKPKKNNKISKIKNKIYSIKSTIKTKFKKEAPKTSNTKIDENVFVNTQSTAEPINMAKTKPITSNNLSTNNNILKTESINTQIIPKDIPKVLGPEIIEKTKENKELEEKKQSFEDIKKKMNNIFDD